MYSNSIFPVIRENVPARLRRDLYHDLLTLGWRKTLLLFVLTLLLINSFFATLYWLDPKALLNSDGSWLSAFFFSVQTLATIGYGYWSPDSTFAHVVVTVEAAIGLVLMAIMAGFFFAKFSRTVSKLEFTNNIILTNFNGKPTLVFRMINIRKNQILDSTVHLTLLKDTVTQEGQRLRRFMDLKLVRSQVPVFTMSMSLMHVLDEKSPLFGLSEKSKEEFEIVVSVIGTDGTFGQTIHATHLYRTRDLIWNKTFADMVEVSPDGTRIVDYGKFNSLVP